MRGDLGEYMTQPEIAEKRGWSAAAFKADYRYLSSHAHSDGLSLCDLLANKASGLTTEETRERLAAMSRVAANHLALIVKEVHSLFPQFKMAPAGIELIQQLVDRLK